MLSNARTEEPAVTSQPAMQHRPVLPDAVLRRLAPRPDAVVVDATLGAGGHAEAVLDRLGRDGRLLGIDRDPRAIETARERLARFGDRFVAIRGRYEDLAALLREAGVFAVDGVVADLGVSSMQLDDPARGFSFRLDGPLDMRMDPTSGETAADLLNRLPERELARILKVWGEERMASAIARAVARRRAESPFREARELAELVERVLGPRARRYRIHPATRTFQALRIAVNGEIEGIRGFVTDAASMLRRSGRLVVIAFHSLEDRAVKQAFRELAHRCVCPPSMPVCGCGRENVLRILTPKPDRPSESEVRQNPRARSARLRAAERI